MIGEPLAPKIRGSFGLTFWASVEDTIRARLGNSIPDSFWNNIRAIRASVRTSLWASLWVSTRHP